MKGLGIVGAGLISEIHAHAIKDTKNSRLVAVCDVNLQRAQEFAKLFKCKAYSSVTEMLKDSQVEVVTICTPSGFHLDPAMEVINSGRPLLIEKPIEINLERCDAILELADKKNVLVSGVFQSRFHPASLAIRHAMEQERFGRVTLGDAYVKWYRAKEYYTGWKGTKKIDGGGALINQSIHAIDLLQWFMGPVKSVQAKTSTLLHDIEVEDTAVAFLEFESGALGVIEGTTSVYPGYMKRIEISGSKGTAIMEEEEIKAWDFLEKRDEDKAILAECSGSSSSGGAADPGAINYIGHKKQIENFIESVETNKAPFITGEDARKSLAIIMAIYQSSSTGKAVELE
ncbi:Gfo/Idh/MocA family oxidoreductase [Oceanispirochaeta crateris]|uniref:Gfo/Idh/MocA family oxidoreductase n=1 Tax=Oceanispirochaeta crateris TaxID=2518645 RepID=A0A5C1QFD2_9SPIO|nr:Gfo/Idh/MocA family oxidoreductase [Oceanispirochaeta crateris]QEN06745.1 Gfo/Idh/MocA family oxidoreductase [Oceanispirochaeta crateris]